MVQAGADGSSPAGQFLRAPACDLAVGPRHMHVNRRVPALEGAVGMTGQPLAVSEDLDRRSGDAHIDLLACVLVRNRVVVTVDLDVVVNADSGKLPLGVLIGLCWQGAQGWLIHFGEGAGAAAGQLLERALVQGGQQGTHLAVQFAKAEEALMAQARQHPARHHQHRILHFRFVLGAAYAGRQHSHAVVVGKVLIGRVKVRLVARRLGHAAAQIVRHPQLGATAEEVQGTHMAGDPVGQLLGPGRLDVGVVRRAQNGNEDLGLLDLASSTVRHGHRLAGVVDEQLLSRRVGLAHRQRQPLAPAPVVVAEGAVLEAVLLPGLVLLPQQFQCHALAAQFVVDAQPVRRWSLHRRRLAGREQQPFQGRFVQLRRQRITQARQLGTCQVIGHGGRRDANDASDFSLRSAVAEIQPQYFLDFTHG